MKPKKAYCPVCSTISERIYVSKDAWNCVTCYRKELLTEAIIKNRPSRPGFNPDDKNDPMTIEYDKVFEEYTHNIARNSTIEIDFLDGAVEELRQFFKEFNNPNGYIK